MNPTFWRIPGAKPATPAPPPSGRKPCPCRKCGRTFDPAEVERKLQALERKPVRRRKKARA